METLNLSVGERKSYIKHLINKTYKILPLKEESMTSGDYATLVAYTKSYLIELKGAAMLLDMIKDEPIIIDVMGTIEYLSKNVDKCSHQEVKVMIFRCIHTLNKLLERVI
jgi:hypothetical protein